MEMENTEQVVFSAGCSAYNQPAEVSVSQRFITGVWAVTFEVLRGWEEGNPFVSISIGLNFTNEDTAVLQGVLEFNLMFSFKNP